MEYPYGTYKGSRCSGWGVYPGGRKCGGCDDCKPEKFSKQKSSNMAKGKIISTSKVKRKKGYLLYVDGEGNVRETPMKRGGTKGHKTCKSAKPKKKAAKKRPAAKKTVRKKAAKKRPSARKKSAKKK